MAYIAPKNLPRPKQIPLNYWPSQSTLLNGGLNLVDREWKIGDNQTSKVINMWFREGELSKRFGQDFVNADIGTIIYSSYRFIYNGKIVFHSNTKLYTLDTATGTTEVIYEGLTTVKGSFFKFNQKLYYKQAGKYIQWDGTTASEVIPYIPEVIQNRTPSGGGDTNEGYNRIGKGFRNSFNGNGAAVAYQLTDTNLDADLVSVTISGVAKVETTDFSVNRVTGIVTFVAAPATGQNNVIITAYKTDQEAIDSILNCKYAMPFGGQNDNRMFFAGNGTGYFYYTGISTVGVDATYFPYNSYNIIGNSDEDITGFGKQYDTLCIFKEREIYGETYTWNGTIGVFNTFPINSQIGCDCPDTIQTIKDNLTWLNSAMGVYMLVGTAVQSEKNIQPLSRNINPRLLQESNIKDTSSIDFNGKYWLCVNDKVYLWDYSISPYYDTGNPEDSAKRLSWWYFDSINAGSWITDGQDLFYADRTVGRVVKFITVYDGTQFYDFGLAINSMHRIPLRDLGSGLYEFDVINAWVDCRGDTKTGITITYITSDDINGDPSIDTIEVGSFSYDTFSYDTFTYQVMGYKETFPLSPMEKKIDLFGIEFSNNDAGRDMNISSVMYSYRLGKKK